MRITDDGIGAPADPPAAGGLANLNLRSRAVDIGGTSSVRLAEGCGTVLEWRVPLAGIVAVPVEGGRPGRSEQQPGPIADACIRASQPLMS